MKNVKKVFKWLFIIFFTVIICGLIYGSISQYIYDKKVSDKFEPTGNLVELPENTMHYELIGSGDFTFILETGLGENINTWRKIKDSLSQMGRVFLYDRSGLGFSDANSKARTTRQIAIELNKLLITEDIPGPYVLVGHSIGGAHIRYYANMFPKDVAGLFLIDSSHEKMKDGLSPPSLGERFFRFSAVNLSWSGIPFHMLPAAPHPTYKTSKSIKAYGKEIRAIDSSIDQFKSTDMNLSNMPIYIISATASDGEYKDKNLKLMEELIDHSDSEIKKHLIYDKPHHIHLTDPEIVLTDLKEFVNRIFAKKTVANNGYK